MLPGQGRPKKDEENTALGATVFSTHTTAAYRKIGEHRARLPEHGQHAEALELLPFEYGTLTNDKMVAA